MNVGTEEIKGNQQVKLAAALLQQAAGLNYRGFIEGDGLYRGEADVVVCDGFVGNILLKSSEGLAGMLVAKVEALFRRSIAARIVGAVALPLLRRLRAELNPAQYNGASFQGCRESWSRVTAVLALMDSRRPFAAQRRMSSMIFPRSYETVSGSFQSRWVIRWGG